MKEPSLSTLSPTELANLVSNSTGPWTLDPTGSSIRFAHATFWRLAKVKGTFTGMNGDGRVEPDGAVRGTLRIDAASIDTGNNKRDQHLRSEHFFKAEDHPEITFQVESARPADSGIVIDGVLTIAGITRPLQVPAIVEISETDTVTLTAKLTVDRADYGMHFNQVGMIRGPASLEVTARFIRPGGPT